MKTGGERATYYNFFDIQPATPAPLYVFVRHGYDTADFDAGGIWPRRGPPAFSARVMP